jgi:uncharacterized membrane protein YfcA
MEKKILFAIGTLVALGTALAIFVGGLVFDLVPFNNYVGVFWMLFIPVALFYMLDDARRKRKFIINMLCSFAVGLVWGWVSVITTPLLKSYGEIPFALVEYLVLMFLIMFVHGPLLKNTVFNVIPAVYMAFALSIASSTTMWFSGHIDPKTFLPLPIDKPWNQLDLLIVYIIGCGMTWLIETVCIIFVEAYLKKKNPEAGHQA